MLRGFSHSLGLFSVGPGGPSVAERLQDAAGEDRRVLSRQRRARTLLAGQLVKVLDHARYHKGSVDLADLDCCLPQPSAPLQVVDCRVP